MKLKPRRDIGRGLFVEFGWDENKNSENIRKHGFDFADAWEIFESPMLTRLDTREDYGEERWVGIGLLGNRVVVIVLPNQMKTPYGLSPYERR